MQIRVTMTVKPWATPNYVLCTSGDKENSIPIAEAGPDVIRALAIEWLIEVYKKAGVQPDWRFE